MSAQPSTSTSAAIAQIDNAPTPQQLLFAKSIMLTFELWPAMRLAVSEQWGGPDSADKRDFLLSHLCDQYGNPGSAFEPDLDDLADILEGYMIDEYEARLEDGSPDWVAGRIVGLHRVIFAPEEDTTKAQAAVRELEKAYEELKGKKATFEQGKNEDGEVDGEDADEEMRDARSMAQSHGGVTEADRQGARVGLEQDQARAAREPQGPIVDEDGFETVVSRRRRK
ncbi:Pre-rRNA-processing protein TSR2 [Kalmanozyma brasiliensis GHG001]|uniref:Pre-rRNA-processing protein TSR2 n=1 Tax=Kalmanozyma brasiliensis (strain GHG001) TaxID=1365824 RepID=V5ERH8_KALBG|nr:Pre-rRNA-processing protein TSR2 [Kalmanozyma brasiliensis GHG001]EST04479.1 Pre-rRNA-processing protein TSR2 [Kalmanozyma brasiliensis GHG001]